MQCPHCRQALKNEKSSFKCDCGISFDVQENIPLFFPLQNDSFCLSRLELIARMERTHFWFQGRQSLINELIQRHLPLEASIADLGCGTGWVTECLSKQGFHMLGLDFRAEGLIALKKRAPQISLLQGNVEQLPLLENSFDGVLLLDLLEHVDDQVALKEACRIVRPGGWVFLTVPAHCWLWSQRDERAGHRRRYSKSMLLKLAQEAGLTIKKVGYYQCFLFPLFVFSRLLSRCYPAILKREETTLPFFNRFFSWIAKLEARIAGRISLPFGSTLFAIGKK